ncbi:MAG: hypothetical protein V4773_06980 [Verrucomicrobiota bacterium]
MPVIKVNLNYVTGALAALFTLYVTRRIYRSLVTKGESRMLTPVGWLLAGVLTALCAFVSDSATVIFAYMGVYWLTNGEEGKSKP